LYVICSLELVSQEPKAAFGPCPPFLPIPGALPTDAIHVHLIACYLSYSLATISSTLFSSSHANKLLSNCSSTTGSVPSLDDILCIQLQELFKGDTLLAWSPRIREKVPVAQMNSLLKHAYSSLVQSSARNSHTHPNSVFALRSYGLLCLLTCRDGGMKPATFWDQAIRFCTSLIQRTSSEDGRIHGTSLSLLSRVIDEVERHEDVQNFKTSNGFVTFCELWLDTAQKVSFDQKCAEIIVYMPPIERQCGRPDQYYK
jgi:hypothetical protein